MNRNNTSAFAAATGSDSLQPAQGDTVERFLRRPEVCHLTSLPSSSLTDLISKSSFPKPYKLSERMSAWKLSEVKEWINTRQKAA